MTDIRIEQKDYGNIYLDNTEKDIIQLWGKGKDPFETNLIILERSKVKELVSLLLMLELKEESK